MYRFRNIWNPILLLLAMATSWLAYELHTRNPFWLAEDTKGHTLTPMDFPDRVLVIAFWTSADASPLKQLNRLQSQYGSYIQVVAVSMDDFGNSPRECKPNGHPLSDSEAVGFIADRMNAHYPVVLATPDMRKLYGAYGQIPNALVISSSGRIAQSVSLTDYAAMEQAVFHLLSRPKSVLASL